MEETPSDASGRRARLRQRLFEGGAGALLDHELVESLLALAIPMTRDLLDADRHMQIAVHDHVIVGAQVRSSMKAMGLT